MMNGRRGPARVAIVTASDSGIGKATAVALAADGYDVGITWHSDEDGANETAAEDVDPRTLDRPDVPAGRPGDAREVASLIAWLCGTTPRS